MSNRARDTYIHMRAYIRNRLRSSAEAARRDGCWVTDYSDLLNLTEV